MGLDGMDKMMGLHSEVLTNGNILNVALEPPPHTSTLQPFPIRNLFLSFHPIILINMSCSNESHSHDHDHSGGGHGHGHDHDVPLESGPSDSLYGQIDLPNVVALNAQGGGEAGQRVIKCAITLTMYSMQIALIS